MCSDCFFIPLRKWNKHINFVVVILSPIINVSSRNFPRWIQLIPIHAKQLIHGNKALLPASSFFAYSRMEYRTKKL